MGSKKANTENTKNKGENKKKNKGNNSLKSDDNSPLPSTSNGKVISDPRFSLLHTDPRFREAPKRETKVAIDSRFKRMFTHKSFLPSSAPVDKRGKRKHNSDPSRNALRHYYKIDEKDNKKVEEDSSDEEEEEEEEEGLIELNSAKLDEDDETESEETSETESAIDTDTDEGVNEKYYEEDEADQEEITTIDKETNRLAVVKMDWRHVKAVDLYVLLSSFIPPNGLIKSVAVYPTEFGIQRMKEEEVRGPVGLFDDENEKNDEDRSDDEEEDTDNEKLREYEKSKMRYYHAVVECDSIATADQIYKECDGLEFLHSSNPLDLRFIPDNMEFKHPPRDVATEAPANYEHKDFYSRALQHSKVDLTWDEDEPLREDTMKHKFSMLRTLKRDLNDEQLAELEMKEFFTSDVSDNEDGEDNNETDDQPNKMVSKKDAYLGLLCSGNGSDEDAEHANQEMEVTFNTALQDINKHITKKKDQQSETTWEAYLRKRREKRKARKNKSNYSSSSSSDDDDSNNTDQEATEEAGDDFFIEQPAVKKKKRAQSEIHKDHNLHDMDEVEEATKEELELLLADDKGTDTGLKGYNLKFKKGKGKKRESAIDEEKIPNSAYDDPRFEALFTSEYAIDPTDPQFKRSASYARQLAQKSHKSHVESSLEREREPPKLPEGTQLSSGGSGMLRKGEEEGLDALKSKDSKYELSSLVKSIKMKSKQFQLSSDGKTMKDGKSQSKGKEKRRH